MRARSDNEMRAVLADTSVALPFSGCHIWMASCMKNGYGQVGYQGKNAYAHRVSWILHRGPIPADLSVLHECDVRCCINPAHLFLGDARANVLDMMTKGRQHMRGAPAGRNPMQLHPGLLSGERHGMAKLTRARVSEIRSRYASGETQKHLGIEYGVNQPHISRIIRNENWK